MLESEYKLWLYNIAYLKFLLTSRFSYRGYQERVKYLILVSVIMVISKQKEIMVNINGPVIFSY